MSYRKTQYVKAFGGGGEEDKKAVVVKKEPTVIKAPDRFTAWGNLNKDAQDKGWYPVGWNNETTEYRNRYNNNFNSVDLPNNQKGYIAVIGGNRNGIMDVVIKDANGNVLNKLLQGVRPEQVDAYFRSKDSSLQGRTDKLIANNNAQIITAKQ